MTKYKEFNEDPDDYDEDYIWTSRITHVIVCHYSVRPQYGAKGLEIGEPCTSCDKSVKNKVALLLNGDCTPEYGGVLCRNPKPEPPKVY